MQRIMTGDDHRRIREAKSFDDLLQVGLSLVVRLPKPTIQLSGPVTTGGYGSQQKNITAFRAATELFKTNGHTVFDFLVFQESMLRLIADVSPNRYCTELLEVFFGGMIGSGHISAVHFLPGWERSTGSCWEREYCIEKKVPFFDFPNEWLRELEEATFSV